jgi:hypothetical protein
MLGKLSMTPYEGESEHFGTPEIPRIGIRSSDSDIFSLLQMTQLPTTPTQSQHHKGQQRRRGYAAPFEDEERRPYDDDTGIPRQLTHISEERGRGAGRVRRAEPFLQIAEYGFPTGGRQQRRNRSLHPSRWVGV